MGTGDLDPLLHVGDVGIEAGEWIGPVADGAGPLHDPYPGVSYLGVLYLTPSRCVSYFHFTVVVTARVTDLTSSETLQNS